ncbi:MAG: protein kinase [Polyangiaceae bacterium]|nr:protein kinase [Polyangiaceae bacterium]
MISLPAQGERLGKYELVTVLAKSPLGPTCLAQSTEPSDATPAVVAVRRLTLGSALPKTDKDLLAQAAVWALSETSEGALNSVDIVVTGHELGLVREHAIGQPLRTLLRRCTLNAQIVPSTVALRLALDVLETLNVAGSKDHRLASGVAVHCGLLGPDFLWVTSDGRTLLTDIGVSSALRAAAAFGGLADLVAYSAPEQLSGSLDDQRSDIFVLGVMLWELLSGGRRLFQGSDPSGVATAVSSAPIVAPTASGSTPSEVETAALDIVMRALDRDLDQRFQSPAQMRQAIADLAPSAVASREEVASLIAILSGGELAMQDEAVRRALGHASSQHADATTEARKPVSTAPSSMQPRLSPEQDAPPVSSPPPKPASSLAASLPSKPASSPASQPPAPLAAGLNGPASAVPESVPPQTDEVDSAWGEEQGSAAIAPAAAASTPVVAGVDTAAEGVAPAAAPAPRPGASTPSAALSPSASQQPSNAQSAALQSGAARVITLASAGSAPSRRAVSVSEASARAIAAEPSRSPRWQIAATAVFLALAGLFAIIALMRKPATREPKSVVAVAEVATATEPASSAAPSTPTPTVVAPSTSAEPAVPAEMPAGQARADDAGPTGEGEDASSLAAALSGRLSGSRASARNEPDKPKTKGKGARSRKKTSGSAGRPRTTDVLTQRR